MLIQHTNGELRITNAAAEMPKIWLYGDIGAFFEGITPDDFRKALESLPAKSEIEVHISSEGGIFHDGVTMHSLLRQRKAPVHVVVDGIAASAASIVAMGGTTISIASHAWMMIHEARSAGKGTATDFREEADRLDAINADIVRIYSGRWKGAQKDLVAALKRETWYTSDQSIEVGLADGIIDTMAVAARVDALNKFSYRHTPTVLLAKSSEGVEFPRLTERTAILTSLFGQKDEEKCEST